MILLLNKIYKAINMTTKIYEKISKIYDKLMDAEFYDEYLQLIKEQITEEYIVNDAILDIACGSGILLSNLNFDYKAGIDLSDNFLRQAEDRLNGDDFSLLNADMKNFQLDREFDLILCTSNTINYLLTEKDLRDFFETVKIHMVKEGIFIFDLNTLYYYQNMRNNIKKFEEEKFVVFWENEFELDRGKITINLFEKQEDGNYLRFMEEHLQRGYSIELLKKIIIETFEYCKIEIIKSKFAKNTKKNPYKLYFKIKKQ